MGESLNVRDNAYQFCTSTCIYCSTLNASLSLWEETLPGTPRKGMEVETLMYGPEEIVSNLSRSSFNVREEG